MVVWSDLRGAARATAVRQAGFPPRAATGGGQAGSGSGGRRRRGGTWRRRIGWLSAASTSFLDLHRAAAALTSPTAAKPGPPAISTFATLGWNGDLIAHQRLDERIFPRLADTCGVMARTSRAVLGAEVPIAADIADQQSALMANGGEARARPRITFGTSATANLGTGAELVSQKSLAIPPFIPALGSGGTTTFCLEAHGDLRRRGDRLARRRSAPAQPCPFRRGRTARKAS